MNQIQNPIYSLEQLSSEYLSQKKRAAAESTQTDGTTFQEVLKQKQIGTEETVTFSRHASERLNSRNIQLTDTQLERLNQGVDQARDKNINESLVLLDDLAFIVNVKNNTVVTALDSGSGMDRIFTNIDGAVIL